MESFVRFNLLFDFYGQLLTKRQQLVVQWYYDHDLSLAEIAEQLSISRQGVHDLLRRSQQSLESYEKRLGLVERFRQERQRLDDLKELLVQLQDCQDSRWQRVFELLEETTSEEGAG